MSVESPYVITRIAVETVERLSKTFVRITFGGQGLADVGTAGPVRDQRIKLTFDCGAIRTYSIRKLIIGEAATQVVIDFVLHLHPESSGPAARWASTARPGDELLFAGPRRGRTDGGGIEYAPGEASSILLAGDETAAPAIARILEDADRGVRGVAFIEVPLDGDILSIDAPHGVDVCWLPRAGGDHGGALVPAVLNYLGASSSVSIRPIPIPIPTQTQAQSDDLLWETPSYSGLGEQLVHTHNCAERYFWIAGESAAVTTLRRHLVTGLGIDRSQVAFMGYWRKSIRTRSVNAGGS